MSYTYTGGASLPKDGVAPAVAADSAPVFPSWKGACAVDDDEDDDAEVPEGPDRVMRTVPATLRVWPG